MTAVASAVGYDTDGAFVKAFKRHRRDPRRLPGQVDRAARRYAPGLVPCHRLKALLNEGVLS